MNAYMGIAICLLLLGFAGLIAKIVPFYSVATKSIGINRYETLDGLRGFLVLGVFFHHSVFSQYYLLTGKWEIPKSATLLLGPSLVGVFFMITGFLFWSKLLKSGATFNITQFYEARLRRILPMYLVSFAVILIIVLIKSHGHILVERHALIVQVGQWIAQGIVGFPDINGVFNTRFINAGVFWSLTYEWCFYIALPFLALFKKGQRFVFLALIIIVFSTWVGEVARLLYFLCGATCALIMSRYDLHRQLKKKVFSVIAFASILAMLILFRKSDQTAYGLIQALMMFIFFLIVVNGNSLFGVLNLRSARMLGAASYSFYVLHGIVLFLFTHLAFKMSIGYITTPAVYGAIIALAGVATVFISAATYRYIEHPFLTIKRKSKENVLAPQPA